MNIRNTMKTIKALMTINKPVFLWGQPGNAKTQSPKQLAEEIGYGYVSLYLGQTADVADILGIMTEGEDGTFHHLRPSWFPTEGKHIIHLDEFNRCHPDLLQSMLAFLQTGRFHNHQLPEGCYIIAGGNPNDANHQVTSIDDDAIKSRFVHINVEIELNEWIAYAETKGCHKMVLNFIRENPEFLGNKGTQFQSEGDMAKPNPRTWLETISGLEENKDIDNIRYEVYSGAIGKTAAARFMAFRSVEDKKIDYKDVLDAYSSVRDDVLVAVKANRIDKLNQAVEEILLKMEDNKVSKSQVENFKKFMLDIPLELSFKICQKLTSSKFGLKDMIVNDPEYLAKFKVLKNSK